VPIITTVQPYAFPIALTEGESSLAQAVLRWRASAFMTAAEIMKDPENIALFDYETKEERSNGDWRFEMYGVPLTYHLDRIYAAKPIREVRKAGPIELDKPGHHNPLDFFDLLEGLEELSLIPNRLYLLGTQQIIRLGNVCGILSRETPETGSGAWGHFAGIFQPGFYGPITMEMRSQSRKRIAGGSVAGYVIFDKMDSRLAEGQAYSGPYQEQDAPMLPKPFKQAA
ncbi:MAG: 2'-deoxycytidine 5'-triphosphate deaminase, partial [Nanoarchaeota archaeon]